MKKICVITGSRAEYSLLYPTMKAIDKSTKIELQLVVTGSHLSISQGLSVDLINNDNIRIDYEIDMLIDSKNKSSIPKSMGLFMIQLAQCFDCLKPDMILVLGDRYEILSAVTCAMAMNIPIVHMSGGESTEGAIDEQIRHAITKMAHIHLAGTDISKNNIIKMGEQPFRVFNVGEPAVENINNFNFLSKEELEKRLEIKLIDLVFIITYHPVTLMDSTIAEQVKNILDALNKFNGTFVFTGSNADFGGNIINDAFKRYVNQRKNCYFFQNLGYLYMNLCKNADIMIGNSSSGLIEAPCFKLPVVNVGERQKGRLRHLNVIDVGYDSEEIVSGINKALNDNDFKNHIKEMENLYGDGTTSKKIVKILEDLIVDNELMFKRLEYHH